LLGLPAMNLSRPFGKTALGIIALILLALSGLLVFDALSDGRSAVAGKAAGLRRATEAVASTRSAVDAPSPVAATPTTAVLRQGGTPLATPSPQDVAPTATLPSRSTARPASPGMPDTEPTVAAEPPPEEGSALATPVGEWQRVQVAELGLAFEVPAGWPRLGAAWAWSPDGESAPHVGFKWSEGSSPSEMVPTPSVVTAVKTVNLGWVEGQSVQVEVMSAGSVVAVEKHVVVQIDTDLSGDFYVTGRSTADLRALDAVLTHLLTTIIYQAVPDGPVEVSAEFLTALLNDPEGETAGSFLSASLQAESPVSLLRIEGMYSSFSVYWSAVVDGRIQVLATLRYPGDRVEQRVLHLVKQDGVWRIDEITSAS
jgi:hypothetical protein